VCVPIQWRRGEGNDDKDRWVAVSRWQEGDCPPALVEDMGSGGHHRGHHAGGTDRRTKETEELEVDLSIQLIFPGFCGGQMVVSPAHGNT
jgi:hypothetical protein